MVTGQDESLNVELFDTVLEAQVLAQRYRRRYNTARPHSAGGYRPPAPKVILLWPPSLAFASLKAPALT